MSSVALIGCSKMKLDRPAPARLLYSPSHLFSLSVRWAEEVLGAPWHVLSAKHGVVGPDQVLAPYDVAMSDFNAADREAWRRRVGADLAARHPAGTRFVWLCGGLYLGALRFIPRPGDYEHDEPMRGLQIGERLRWLSEQLRAKGAAR